MSELTKRILSALVMILVFFYLIYDASIVAIIFSGLVFSIILWEYLGLIKKRKNKIIFILVFVLINIMLLALLSNDKLLISSNLSIYFFAISSFSWIFIGFWVFKYQGEPITDLRVSLLGALVLIPAMYSLFIILTNSMYPLLIIGAVSIADTSAYFVGRRLGKRPIIPNVSPGKTVEGLIGSLIITPLFTSIAALILDNNIIHFLFFGVAVSLISFIGDVFFSLLKRNRNIKESSNLIPGHGGFIDLLDGTIAILPFFALSFLLALLLDYNFLGFIF
jgi:phosphatidate cytidylyltransferase